MCESPRGSCCVAAGFSPNAGFQRGFGDREARLAEKPGFGWGMDSAMLTVLLLLVSNVFMTFAWYGHLKFKGSALWVVILASWGLAFFEYCFQVPANRYGHGQFTAAQLKMMQEVITLLVFAGFSWLYLGERLRWNDLVGFGLIVAAVFFVFVLRPENAPHT
jgi:uncharacterized protein (DUF486 family)